MSASAFPYRARATMKYRPPPQPGQTAEQAAQQFALAKGDEVTVSGQADDEGDWLQGAKEDGVEGIFPAAFVERIESGAEPTAAAAEPEKQGEDDAPAAPKEATASEAVQQTVEDTPVDRTNVEEAQDAPGPAEEETTLREPEAAVEEPSVADVTASTENSGASVPVAEETPSAEAPAATSPSSAPADDAPKEPASSAAAGAKAMPPPPAKKPNALASRIAAFNAAMTTPSQDPPVPRPKPRQWSRPTPSASDAPPAAPIASPPMTSPPMASPGAMEDKSAVPAASPSASSTNEEQSGFSAADAQQSIARGGGSLRDRIKFLQGGAAGGMGARADPSAKPWKKKASTDEAPTSPSAAPAATETSDENAASTTSAAPGPPDSEENLRDAVVLDSPPAVEHKTAEEPATDIPGFEPAEEDESAVQSPPAASEAVKSPPASAAEPAAEKEDNAADSEAMPASVPIPALPKRAAGPRARKAKSPAATSPTVNEPKAAPSLDKAGDAQDAPKSAEAGTASGDDILASMGGASKMLATDDDGAVAATAPADDDDDFGTPSAPPPMPASRPPVPPQQQSFEEPELEEGEEELRVDPSEATGGDQQRTIAEEAVEALPSTDEPAAAEPTAAPMSPGPGRPPQPPPFVRQQSEEEPAPAEEDKGDAGLPAESARQPPIPTHRPPRDAEKMTTAAEDSYMEKQPDLVTPPEEAADESTVAPEKNAPLTGIISQGRHSAGQQPAGMGQPAFGKMEGTSTPAVEQPPPMLAQENAEKAGTESSEAPTAEEAAQQDEEEEDPEVVRRRALAARMAKLGGRGPLMGGPMMGFGGLPPKKPVQKKPDPEDVPQEPNLERLPSKVVESDSASASGETTPEHPPRKTGGPPLGGFALPGFAPRQFSQQAEPQTPLADEAEIQETPKVDTNDKIALSGAELAKRSAAATDKAFAMADERREAEKVETSKEENRDSEDEEQGSRPPPVPTNRPPTQAPPVPQEEEEEDDEAEAPAQEESAEGGEQGEQVAEPESYASGQTEEPESAEEDDEMPPPPPPPRPAGGHQSSLPLSAAASDPPASPSISAAPGSPSGGLARSATLSSQRSSRSAFSGRGPGAAISPRGSMDASFTATRAPSNPPASGAFLARDLDLSADQSWWRSQGVVPVSLQNRHDVLVDMSQGVRDDGAIEKQVEVIYPDYSKTLITVSYAENDTAEESTSISQAHAPPAMKPNLDALLQWSASLGAQIFAAAHTKMSDKSARGLSDADLIRFCYGRATDPLMPIGGTFGVKVYEATCEQGKKAPMVGEEDEPRAGDIIAISAKFKHNLSSKTVGSGPNGPHLAVVAGWEAKKGKVKVIEIKNGAADENSYRVDEMRGGSLVVFRVAPRDFIV